MVIPDFKHYYICPRCYSPTALQFQNGGIYCKDCGYEEKPLKRTPGPMRPNVRFKR